MEIKSIQPTARFKADLANGQHIELEVAFIASDEVRDYVEPGKSIKKSALFRKLIIGAVSGWNLSNPDKTDIPCNDAMKEKHLPIILGLPVKPGEGEQYGEALVHHVLNFAADSENFLKN